MEKNWFKRWELLISAGLVLATVGFGIYELREARVQQIEAEKEERKIRFWEEQVSLYKEATDAAATLATSRNLKDIQAARDKFWALYWGKIAIVETNAFARAMAEFGDKLNKIEELQENGENTDLSYLKGFSLKLARCARESLLSTWEPVTVSDIGRC